MVDGFIGVDVGTGSARAGVFTADGTSVGQHVVPIRSERPHPGHVEQSSDEIWRAVVEAVRVAHAASGDRLRIRGIGFDATCSLVALDKSGGPVAVGDHGDDAWNVIVWMDHRAGDQAARINAGGHDVLRYVGGRVSLEMQTPKLLWLRERLPEAWRRSAAFFDLPDFLTWRATGADTRSLCSLVCKWTYLGHENRWDEGYFRAIGLGDLADEKWARIGRDVRPIGAPVGRGLDARAAMELGLPEGTPVGTSAIDAHAGGIGTIGVPLDGASAPDDAAFRTRLALVGGTSSCHMAVSVEPSFVPGVWGPYFSAMVPDLWLNEGGQSATGSLIDHVIRTHAASADLARAGESIYEALNARLDALAREAGLPPSRLTASLHVDPDFLGNRSPRADSTLRGAITGLPLAAGADDLARLYLATLQSVAYGTREIIDTLNERGYAIDTILASGGGTKNPVFLREHADATGCRIVLPREPEAVLLGAAVLGAVASGIAPSVRAGMSAMTGAGRIIEPDRSVRRYHDAKYAVFRRLHDDQLAYRSLMQDALDDAA